MGVVGFQDFWVAGARVYIEKQTSGTTQATAPLVDLGVIQSANPSISPEIVQLFDSDSGVRQIVDEGVTSIDESYDVQCSNMNMDNLSLLWLGDDAIDVTRLQEAKLVFQTVTDSRFLKIKQGGDGGDAEWGLRTIDGTYDNAGSPALHLIESMTLSTNVILLEASEGDVTAAYTAAVKLIVSGNNIVDPLNAGTYTVVSSSFGGGKTSIIVSTVTHAINSDEAFGGGSGIQLINPGGQIFTPETDWTVHSKERGIIGVRAGVFTGTQTWGISYSVNALTGARLIKPQSLLGVVKAKVYITYSRDNFGRQTVREFDASITPSAASIQATDYSSMSLTFRVLSDLSKADPAGTLFSYRGDVPPPSEPSSGLD